jgi:ankyrin repeat protein
LYEGVNVNWKDEWGGDTALILASEWGRVEAVELLLDRGGLIDCQNDDGSTALMSASSHGIVDYARLFLDNAGVDMSIKDIDSGDTAKDFAVRTGRVDIVCLLDDISNLVCCSKSMRPRRRAHHRRWWRRMEN